MKTILIFVFAIFMSLMGGTALSGEHNADQADHKASIEPSGAAHQHIFDADPNMVQMAEQMQIGVDERLGEIIDLDLTFKDANSKNLRLGDFIDRPALILPVYFYCPAACSMMLGSLASVVDNVPLTPGIDYRMLAVSFDPEETPELARRAKINYLKIPQKPFPEDQWKFLTGEQSRIDMLLKALGYRNKKTGPHQFVHPNVMIVVSARGKIIRYLYGVNFLPFDIGMALSEASKGTPQLSIRRMLTYCFDYDSEKKTYVFKAFRVIGTVIIIILAVFLFFLLRKGNTGRTLRRKKGFDPGSAS